MSKKFNADNYKQFAKLYKSFHTFGLIPKEICSVLCKIFGINKSTYYKYLKICRDNGQIDTTYEGECARKHKRLLNKDEIKPDEEIREVMQDFISDEVTAVKIDASLDDLVNAKESKKVKAAIKQGDEWVEIGDIIAKPSFEYPSKGKQISLFDDVLKDIPPRSPFNSNTPTVIDTKYNLCYSRLLVDFNKYYVADDMHLLNYGLYAYFIDNGTKDHLMGDIERFAANMIDKNLNGPEMVPKTNVIKLGKKKPMMFDKNGQPIKTFVVLRIVKTEKETGYTQIEELHTRFDNEGYKVYMVTDFYSDFGNIVNKLSMSQEVINGYMLDEPYYLGMIIVDGLHNTSQLNDLKKGFSIYSEPAIIAVMKTNKNAMDMFRKVIIDGERYDISKCGKSLDKVKSAIKICDRVLIATTDGLKTISTEIIID